MNWWPPWITPIMFKYSWLASFLWCRNANDGSRRKTKELLSVLFSLRTCNQSFRAHLTNCRLGCWILLVWKNEIDWMKTLKLFSYSTNEPDQSVLPIFLVSQVWRARRFLRDCSDFIQGQSVHQATVVEVALPHDQVRHLQTRQVSWRLEKRITRAFTCN